MSDPFAPPEVRELQPPLGRVFRAGDILVVPMGRPEWPNRCVRCGEAAQGRGREMFASSPWISWLVAILVGVGVGQVLAWTPVVVFAMGLVLWVPSTVRTIAVPACDRHRPGILASRVIYALSVGLFLVVALPLGAAIQGAALAAALLGIVVATGLGTRLWTVAIADGYVQIRGAHPRLLDAIPDVEAGR